MSGCSWLARDISERMRQRFRKYALRRILTWESVRRPTLLGGLIGRWGVDGCNGLLLVRHHTEHGMRADEERAVAGVHQTDVATHLRQEVQLDLGHIGVGSVVGFETR